MCSEGAEHRALSPGPLLNSWLLV